MKKNLQITASIDQPELLENMVEKLAYKRSGADLNEEIPTGSWQLINTSSIEKFVSGTVAFDLGKNEMVKMPFITCFVFSCTKEINDSYKLNWSMSLS